MNWNSGRPPKHGYYLGAWKRGSQWAVSELWFNPASIGTGWWTGRGYLGQDSTEPLNVVAWMSVPSYDPETPLEGDRP